MDHHSLHDECAHVTHTSRHSPHWLPLFLQNNLHHISPQSLIKHTLSGDEANPTSPSVAVEVYNPGRGRYCQEPTLVPKAGGTREEDVWVMLYVYDAQRQATDLEILDGAAPSQGPVARIRLPLRMPLGACGCMCAWQQVSQRRAAWVLVEWGAGAAAGGRARGVVVRYSQGRGRCKWGAGVWLTVAPETRVELELCPVCSRTIF